MPQTKFPVCPSLNRSLEDWIIAAGICGALEAVTRALAIELAPIRVNLLCAGIVRAELWRNMTESERNGLFQKTRLDALAMEH